MENKNLFFNLGEHFINKENNPINALPNIVPNIKPIKVNYEDTYFKQLADDIKNPLERQITAIEDIANSAKIQADLSSTVADKSIAKSSKSTIISILALIFSIFSFVSTTLANLDKISTNVKWVISYLN